MGFTFEAEDDDLRESLDRTTRSFRSVAVIVPDVAESFRSFGDGLSGVTGQMEGLAEGFTRWASDVATEQMNLTTSLESEITSTSKEALRLGANLGKTGSELKKFTGAATGMAMGMKISVDQAAEAIHGFEKSSKELALFGIKSEKQLAKFAEVSQMGAGELSTALAQMRSEFQFTDEDLKQVVGSFFELGKRTGDVGGALKDLPKMMESIRKRAKGFGVDLPTDQLASFAAGQAALAAGFHSFMKNGEEAKEAAAKIGDAMLGARSDFLSMFAGTKDALPDMMSKVGISFADIGVSMEMLQQSPEQFMAGMSKIVLHAKKMGKDIGVPLSFVESQMEAAGLPAAEIASFFRNADESTLALMADVKSATADLGKFADEGFSAGWTLQDRFERMKDSFVLSFRKIGKSAAVDFVDETGKEFKRFTKQLEGVVAEGGPLASLVTKFSEVHQIGALALLPKTLRPMGAVFGEVAGAVTPTIHALGAFGLNLGTIGQLFTPGGLLLGGFAALAGWFGTLRLEGLTTDQAIDSMLSTIVKGAGDLATKLPGFLERVVESVVDLATKLIDALAKVDWVRIGKALFEAAKVLAKMSLELGGRLAGWIIDGLKAVDWAGLLKDAVALTTGLWEWIADAIASVDWDAAGKDTARFFSETLPEVGKAILKWGQEELPGILMDLGRAAARVLGGIAEGMGGFLVGAFGGSSGTFYQDNVEPIVSAVGEGFLWIGAQASHLWSQYLRPFFQYVSSNWDSIRDTVYAVGTFIYEYFATVVGLVSSYLSLVWDAASFYFGLLYDQAVWVWDQIGGTVWTFLETIYIVLENAWTFYTEIYASLYTTALEAWSAISGFVDKAWTDYIKPAFAEIERIGGLLFEPLRTAAEEVFGWIIEKLTWVEDKFLGVLRTAAEYTGGLVGTTGLEGALGAASGAQLKSVLAQSKKVAAVQTEIADTAAETGDHLQHQFKGILSTLSTSAKTAKPGGGLAETLGGALPSFMSGESKTPGEGREKKISKPTADFAKKTTSVVSADLQSGLVEEVQMALEKAFKDGFKHLDKSTRTFTTSEIDLFAKMTKDIVRMFDEMWVKVLLGVDKAVTAIFTDVEATRGAIGALAASLAAMRAAERVAEGGAAPTVPTALATRNFASTDIQDQILEATRYPDWYYLDYKPMFEKTMAELISTVASSGATAAKGGAYKSASKREAKDFDKGPTGYGKTNKTDGSSRP